MQFHRYADKFGNISGFIELMVSNMHRDHREAVKVLALTRNVTVLCFARADV